MNFVSAACAALGSPRSPLVLAGLLGRRRADDGESRHVRAAGRRLHGPGRAERRRAGVPSQPVGEHQGEQPLRRLPRRRRPVADVRAQRRREPRLPGGQHVVNLAQPDQSRMVVKVAGGHNCWLAVAFGLRRHADRLDPQLGRRDRHGRHADPAAGADRSRKWAAARPSRTTRRWLRGDHLARSCDAVPSSCARCHSPSAATPQPPFFASDDRRPRRTPRREVEDQSRQPGAVAPRRAPARRVPQLLDADCVRRTADAMRQRHAADAIRPSPTASRSRRSIRPCVISKALTLYDGTVAAGGNRYRHQRDRPVRVQDRHGQHRVRHQRRRAGAEPHAPSGDVTWVGGWGINIKAGRQGAGHDGRQQEARATMIKSTGEFSIEAWMAPANVAQEDAYVVSYSGGAMARNVTLAQRAYQYEALHAHAARPMRTARPRC